jgi:hypothetical protein
MIEQKKDMMIITVLPVIIEVNRLNQLLKFAGEQNLAQETQRKEEV